MPTIPLASRSLVQTGPAGIRRDADAENAPNRALTAVGGAVMNVAGVLGDFALQKQAQVNRGIMAQEETVRMETAAQIQSFVEKNPDKPETWGKFQDDTWKAYDQGRTQRMKAEKWGPAVVGEDTMKFKEYQAETGIHFRAAQDKAFIRQSNARMEANATEHLRSGNVKAALASINAMNLYEDQRRPKVEQITNGFIYGEYDREMSNIDMLPPAKQAQELARIEQELTATDKDGKPVNGWVEDESGKRVGGLGQPGRTDLIRAARARMRAAEVQMAQSGKTLVRQTELGVDPAMAFHKALDAGQITEDVARIFVPEVNAALMEKQAKEAERAERAAEKLGIRRDRAEAAAHRMIDARGGATLTMEEIERREARGITRPNDPTGLTAEAANRLREQLQAVESEDQMTPDFSELNDLLESKIGQGVTRTFFWDNAQMSPLEKQKILEDINAARISVGAKLKLVDKFFEAAKWDLREGEISDSDGDRNIGREEKGLRTSLIEHYRKAGRELGPRSVGARYMADMKQVSDWFAANEGASPAVKEAKVKEFYEATRKSVADEASLSILRTIPIYQ